MENGHSSPKKQEPFEVLILGGSYGGLSTALNLLDLCNGKPTRAGFENPIPDRKVPVNVTVLDERDGFCKIFFSISVTRILVSVLVTCSC